MNYSKPEESTGKTEQSQPLRLRMATTLGKTYRLAPNVYRGQNRAHPAKRDCGHHTRQRHDSKHQAH